MTTRRRRWGNVANDNASDFCAEEEARAFLLPLLLFALPVREILLNKFFNDFYYTPASQPANLPASQSLRQPLCRYTHASIHVCVWVCMCVSVRVCIVSYIAASGGNTTTHTKTAAHTRATHDIASEEAGWEHE